MYNCPENMMNAASQQHSGLWSTPSNDHALSHLHTKFIKCAFQHAGLSTWNTLPEDIRAILDSENFRKHHSKLTT